MSTMSVEQARVPMIVVTPALPSRHSLPVEMQEALNSTQPLHDREDRTKQDNGTEEGSKDVAGDKEGPGSRKEDAREDHHTHLRPRLRKSAKHARLSLGFKNGEVSSMDDVITELQLVGREDEAGWIVLDRLTNGAARGTRCSNESTTATLVAEPTSEDRLYAMDAAARENMREGHGADVGYGRGYDPSRRHAWYVSTPGWPKFKDPKPSLLGRAVKATRTLSLGHKA
ncbi:uncharacterized protein B0H18DRAFT_1210546 [Fomitopsis serialis]|uniref:uncharacterized protein n=1 Tax=Fomitopsis serialis TaxID=139415 RepID=UPI0020073E9D|nr:uncharacterized protein B0H18DRAFT_1210546 [Neoantrodia serialis]KAH9927834.1 hypothetical protein B0H18DRAFT_1210546 [Neoantrodia serialis]